MALACTEVGSSDSGNSGIRVDLVKFLKIQFMHSEVGTLTMEPDVLRKLPFTEFFFKFLRNHMFYYGLKGLALY